MTDLEIGRNIKQIRYNLGLTQKEFSKALKISNSLLSLYESGDRRVPSIMIDKICDEFKCHKAEILGMDYLNKKSDDNRTILFDIYDNLPQDLKDLLLVRAKELDNINKENLKVAA